MTIVLLCMHLLAMDLSYSNLHFMTCSLAHWSEDCVFITMVLSRLLKLKFFNYFGLCGELRFSSLLFYDWLKKF